MQSSSIFFISSCLLLSCAPLLLSCASTGRRILHEPLLPEESSSSPPPAPASPATQPKYPFSDSNSTPGSSPFFPTYPAPPAPPSPVAFASFPANISSLELPRAPSSRSSSKLVAATVAAVVAAVLAVGIAVFCYCRRRRRHEFSDDKTFRSESSNRLVGSVIVENSSRTQKFRPSSTSSEFLYLGTLVNSRGVDDDRDETQNDGGAVSFHKKPDSPELRPLPPLSRQNCGDGDKSSTADEEEEFYSPRVSLDGRESDSAAGSESRRQNDAVSAEAITSPSVSSSSSSSRSGSPARSQSISLSPPVSSSPRRSQPPKSVESATPHDPPPLPPPRPRIWTAYVVEKTYSSSSSSSRRTDSETSRDGSPTKSDASGKFLRSPNLSPAILLTPNPDSSIRVCSAHSPSLSMTSSSSPDRSSDGNPETPPRASNVTERNLRSPSRGLERNPDASLRIWNPWVHSELSPCSSPERNPEEASPRRSNASATEKSPDSSPRVSNVMAQNVQSPEINPEEASPRRSNASSPEKSPDSFPRVSDVMAQNVQAPVRTINTSVPTPPPPPLPPQRFWESQNPVTSIAQLNSKPPPITNPSRPVMLQNTSTLPPIQLPLPLFETVERVEEETPKPKLKPLHWDKVRASSDREMVWDHLRSSSFKLNEEMIESLFIVNTPQSKPKETTPRRVLPSPSQDSRVLDPKKSQNIAISLRALNVTVDEVCDALLEGNAESLGTELLESLLKMAPTKEEERKLRDFKEDSPIKLGPAEKFLKAVLDVPFAFTRVDAMLYMTNFETEVEYLKKSFETLETACEELRNSRLFLKLLEAVLKTGNRMNVGTNRGDAHAFKLDTLLKLVDVKGADGKTTLLHFVVQEIIRTEGTRLSNNAQTPGGSATSSEDAKCRKRGLEIVSGLSSELANVKKAAAMDSEVLSSDVSKLSRGLRDIEEVLRLNGTVESGESKQRFSESMNRFMKMGEEEIIRIQAQESVALSLVKEITEYFHGNSAKEEAHPFRIFLVVRDFLNVLDRVCKEVSMINERTIVSSAHKFPVPVNPMMPQAVPVFPGRKQYSSSDDESTP